MSDSRWMLFVDGENHAFRGRETLANAGIEIPEGPYWRAGVFLWTPAQYLAGTVGTLTQLPIHDFVRAHYYTSCTGDQPLLEAVQEELRALGFDGEVFKRPKPQSNRSSKGVDIALTTAMLSHAFMDNYAVAVLTAGDGDYVPLVEAVKRQGKRVVLLSVAGGLNAKLRRTCDAFVDFGPHLIGHWEQALFAEANGGRSDLRRAGPPSPPV